jgi:hypothetical protein
MDTQFAVALGNAFDGITLYGPFEDHEEAIEWASENDGGKPWEVVTLESVD